MSQGGSRQSGTDRTCLKARCPINKTIDRGRNAMLCSLGPASPLSVDTAATDADLKVFYGRDQRKIEDKSRQCKPGSDNDTSDNLCQE